MSEQRSILLVPFPFSDQSGQKVRPVIVVSNKEYNQSGEDIIVCAITSNIRTSKYSVAVDNGSMESGTLYKSCIKADSILKIKKSLIIKKIGLVKKKPFSGVLDKIRSLFNG